MLSDNSLFICMTPLQILIAKNIILSENIQNYCFLILYYSDNKKYDHYIQTLTDKGIDVFLYKINSKNKFERFLEVFKLQKYIKNTLSSKFNAIYLSSVDNSLIHSILECMNFDFLFTFDDGLANLYYQGQYYIENESKIQKTLKAVMNISWTLSKVKKQSCCHYSIYKHKKNIINNVKYLSLTNVVKSRGSNSNDKEIIKLYIGQPLNEIDSYFTNDFLLSIFKNLGLNFYFPHPRENINNSIFNYVDSNLIFEEYYMELSEKYEVQLYTFFSTAVLNVLNFDENAKVNIIYDEYLKTKFKDLYEIFEGGACNFVEVSGKNV